MDDKIRQFFTSDGYAVIGASTNRAKYGNKVLRCYLQQHKKVIPVHPKETAIEGVSCVQTINDLPDAVHSISIVTPPAITEKVVEQAIAKGIKNIWMQPGAESERAINDCAKHHINVIAKGPCILAVTGYKDR